MSGPPPWPARPLRIAPHPSSSHFLRGHLRWTLSQARAQISELFLFCSTGLCLLLTRVPSCSPPPLCTSSLFTLFLFHCLPTHPIAFSRVGCAKKGRWGPHCASASLWTPGQLCHPLPCFPPLRGHSQGPLHLGRHPTSRSWVTVP